MLLLTLDAPFPGCRAVAWSPDGAVIADGCYDGQLRIWDAESGAHRTTVRHGECINNLAFHVDGGLYSASDDGTVRIFKLN